jgi:hypothetical protein
MHKLTKITPLIRKEIWRKYKENMQITKWKHKEDQYEVLAGFYRIHYNTIRKIIQRARKQDFSVHLSTTRNNLWCNFKKYLKEEKRILRRILRESAIVRYEKSMAWELVHIDLHKRKNIKWENPKKKKYVAGVIDDATRVNYCEILPNKKAKTLACFIKRAYKWFENKWIIIKKLMSDNGLEFTTHHKDSRPQHSFEKMLVQLGIKHSYTRVRRPQTNWKIERFWRIYEEQFFRKHTFSSNKEFNIAFLDWLVFYNTKRKHWWIQYLTPIQKLEKLLETNKVCLS